MMRQVIQEMAARSATRTVRTALLATTVFCVIACGTRNESAATDSTTVQGTMTASPDPDVPVQGAGIPSGYVVQLDRASAQVSEIGYMADGTGRWEVRTGPAHILYSQEDTVHGKYHATTTVELLEPPEHPEAFGVFIGGSGLDDSTARSYTYFIVRGDGKYSVKVRKGTETKTLKDWTSHAAIPSVNGNGKAVYGITVDVDGETAAVSVNGKPVTTISAENGPLRGIAGVRVNHNLHVMVTPLAITR